MKHTKTILQRSLLLLALLGSWPGLSGQVNFVPNPGFEEIIDCDLEYGEADKATPWKIMNDPTASPDLYHDCSTNPFFLPPDAGSCCLLRPKSGQGMVGLVNLLPPAEERIYARLIDDLPSDIDIYVAYSILPREKLDLQLNYLCYTNTQSLVFSDVAFQQQQVVLKLDTILTRAREWTLVQACYRANGTEKFVLLGNFRTALDIQTDCDKIDPQFNFGYTYVDDVIVSPFDVVPDTLFICGDEVLNIDASFYDVPIQWSDGWEGGMREITEGGRYEVLGDIGDCYLTDETLVIKISDEKEVINVDLCDNEPLKLEAPVPAIWQNGVTSRTFQVSRPGVYTAQLLSDCGEGIREYIVEEKDCNIQYFAPNAFSPNGDGINDRLEFFFKSDYEYTGELNIFDRWGNLVYTAQNVNFNNPIDWDGTYRGKALNSGVLVWVFRYISAKDNKTRMLSGDITLIR